MGEGEGWVRMGEGEGVSGWMRGWVDEGEYL
jgi:hypothetical protein